MAVADMNLSATSLGSELLDVQNVRDRLDIMELVARSARAFDDNDAEGYAACFLADGLYESPKIGLRASGHEELRQLCLGRGGKDIHFVTNFEIVIEGDEANFRSFLLLCAKEGELVNTTGRYEAVCLRTEKGWRFKHKVSWLDRR